jgi:hypothetical protein
VVLLGVVLPVGPLAARAAPAESGLTDSAVTVSGRAGKWDDFSKLRITVSQTANLGAQGVTVSWTGGAPTGAGGFVGKNYLQFMQCWGPDPDADDFRETCQYGRGVVPNDARSAIGLGNANNSRTVGKSTLYPPDPAEELQRPEAGGARSVPFRAVDGTRTPDGGKNNPYPPGGGLGLTDYFSEYTTNEVPYARTTADGTGRITFEVQTGAEAPGLGCGQPQRSAGVVVGRPCWLVIVPRGDHDPAGKVVTGNPGGTVMDGSPLSRGYFANRIAVRLRFEPSNVTCAQGKEERLTVGSELVGSAVQSWQPVLCADNGPVFGFTGTSDAEANQFVRAPAVDGPGLAFVTDARESPPGTARILHAPVALSAAVIAMQIETKINPGSPESVEKVRGTQVRDLKLTPRLVAKLLTQSYRADVPDGDRRDYLPKANARSIRNDPEFLKLNPLFDNFTPTAKPDGLVVTVGSSALARRVWEWVLADPDAAGWLAGRPDEHGMLVNKHYRALFAGAAVPQSFPKEDPSCVNPPNPAQDPKNPDDDVIAVPWCTFALRPYVNSLREAAVQTLRGDAKIRTTWDGTTVPPGYRAAPPQPVGERFMLSITDSASAARYGLAAASLRNPQGLFVAPTDAGMLASVAAMAPGPVPGVLRPDPRPGVDSGYPLTMLSYAAVNRDRPPAVRADYARLLRHAAGDGQKSGTARGQLPPGYVPLPALYRDQTRGVAAMLEQADPGAARGPAPGVAGAAPGGQPGRQPTPTPAGPRTTSPSGVPARGTAVPPVAAGASAPGSAASSTPVLAATERTPAGAGRFVLVAILAIGLLSGIAGPMMLTLGYRRSGPGGGGTAR